MSEAISEVYNISRDYKKLFELVESGYRIPCLVDYRASLTYRDIARVYKYPNSNTIIIGARGIEYGGWDASREWTFEQQCEYMNLEWFDTHECFRSEIEEKDKEIKELKKKIRDLKYYHVIDTWKLQQSYRKQFDWIEQNHPEVYKQIPR